MATLKQIEANRINAQKSTGPRTAEGKAASRANSYKHGLSGDGVVVAAAVEAAMVERKALWDKNYRRNNDEEEWLFDRLVAASIKIDRAAMTGDAHIAEFANRASLSWDQDRLYDAEVLARKLGKEPSLVSRALQRTKQGCQWLLQRWNDLGEKLDDPTIDGWDDAERSLALDLLGVDPALRRGRTVVDAPEGADVRNHRRELVIREAQRLIELVRTSLDAFDRDDRREARATIGAEFSPKGDRIRRYAREATSLYFKCSDRLRRGEAPRRKEDAPRVERTAPSLPARPPVDREVETARAMVRAVQEATARPVAESNEPTPPSQPARRPDPRVLMERQANGNRKARRAERARDRSRGISSRNEADSGRGRSDPAIG